MHFISNVATDLTGDTSLWFRGWGPLLYPIFQLPTQPLAFSALPTAGRNPRAATHRSVTLRTLSAGVVPLTLSWFA